MSLNDLNFQSRSHMYEKAKSALLFSKISPCIWRKFGMVLWPVSDLKLIPTLLSMITTQGQRASSTFSFSFLAFTGYMIRAAPVMKLSSPAPTCGHWVYLSRGADRSYIFSCSFVKGIFVKHALWFGLLDHRSRLVRTLASACPAHDCSVCYAQYKASPEQLVASSLI